MANSKLAQAYERCKPARDALREIDAVCMEVTEDKAGILWERWYVQTGEHSTVNVIVFATPSWWDVFTPIDAGKEIADTVAAIKALAPIREAA